MEEKISTQLVDVVIKAMEDRKAKKIETIDVSGRTPITDSFIICSGTSSTHIRAIADEIEEKMAAAGHPCAHIEGYDGGGWILLDFIDVVAHVFLEEQREFYSIERLWRGPAAKTEIIQ